MTSQSDDCSPLLILHQVKNIPNYCQNRVGQGSSTDGARFHLEWQAGAVVPCAPLSWGLAKFFSQLSLYLYVKEESSRSLWPRVKDSMNSTPPLSGKKSKESVVIKKILFNFFMIILKYTQHKSYLLKSL